MENSLWNFRHSVVYFFVKHFLPYVYCGDSKLASGSQRSFVRHIGFCRIDWNCNVNPSCDFTKASEKNRIKNRAVLQSKAALIFNVK